MPSASPSPSPSPSRSAEPGARPVVLLATIVHRAVTDGLVPACRRAGFAVVLLSDRPEAWRATLDADVDVIGCDVTNPLAIVAALTDRALTPAALLSNSDHLQTQAAIAAEWFELPGKDWRICLAAKNKSATRARLGRLGLPSPAHRLWAAHEGPPESPGFPLVAKPCEGVASLDVRLCETAAGLLAFRESLGDRQARPLLLEAYLRGALFTLETLGDGCELRAVGGFDVSLSSPPDFIELGARWMDATGCAHREAALSQLRAFGVGFGVCHSEFIATETGPVLVEINYRSIGDGREFLLDRMFGGGWFDAILGLHLGRDLDEVWPTCGPMRAAETLYSVAQSDGPVSGAPAGFELRTEDGWAQYEALRRDGDWLTLTRSNKDYLGALRLLAADAPALARLRHAAIARREAPAHHTAGAA